MLNKGGGRKFLEYSGAEKKLLNSGWEKFTVILSCGEKKFFDSGRIKNSFEPFGTPYQGSGGVKN